MARKVTKTKKKRPASAGNAKVKKKKAGSAKTAAAKKTATKKTVKKKVVSKKTAAKKTVAKKTAAKKTAVKKKETKKPEKKAKTKRASRKKVVAEVRLKAFWGVFNQSLKRVALYEYHQKRQAEKRAEELTEKGGTPHFVKVVKEIIEAD